MPETNNYSIDDFRTRESHVSPKGSRFKIKTDTTGLFYIDMENGGIRPPVCAGKYTSFKQAKRVLDTYFEANPKPVPREKSKTED
jgi:hypothetical protein